eukprot:14137135-Alexandrium_andersonii.AAC.1
MPRVFLARPSGVFAEGRQRLTAPKSVERRLKVPKGAALKRLTAPRSVERRLKLRYAVFGGISCRP